MEIGEFIRNARKSSDWTQAFAAREIGIQQSYLSKIENNQLIPSQDVLAKIQLAYNLSDSSFAPFIKKTEPQLVFKKRYIFTFLVGFFLLSSGFLELFFRQTYYTYQAVSLHKSDVVTFHVTDQYLGESYSEVFAQIPYQYSLIGARNIPRSENNWLKALGSFILMFSVCALARDYWLYIKK
ncbi:helix-turn-helix domain-containing protein [Paraglaciecola arctica]|uniref:helix-turn-helix domain-containing protein n=1 Tax=Paraglaciecola arctica TaxID=1128911 RepID=UPI001C06B1FA|nr:helix-turn-helix transcriptional regulator [Paraglaciecola arctica]MBU3002378.1 helix-turn-helix domain-containing protein [Paraglaciecola arctica]